MHLLHLLAAAAVLFSTARHWFGLAPAYGFVMQGHKQASECSRLFLQVQRKLRQNVDSKVA